MIDSAINVQIAKKKLESRRASKQWNVLKVGAGFNKCQNSAYSTGERRN